MYEMRENTGNLSIVMSESDYSRRPVGSKNPVNILIIIIVTIAVTVLGIKFGQSMTFTSDSAIIISHIDEAKHTSGDRRLIHHVETTTETNNVIYDNINLENNISTDYDVIIDKKRPSKNHSYIDNSNVNNKSLGAGTVQNYNFIAPSTRIDFHENPMKRNSLMNNNYINHNNMAFNDDVSKNSSVDINSEIYQKINKKINNYDYWNVKKNDKSMIKFNYNALTNNDDSYDSNNNNNIIYGNRRYTQGDDNILIKNELKKRDEARIKPYSSSVYGPDHSPNIKYYQYPHISPQKNKLLNRNEIDMKILSMLILTKFGLFKLKIFNLLMFLFLILTKLKLFLIAVYFKFQLILKLKNLLKILTFLLLLLPLLPILTVLISPIAISVIFSSLNRLQNTFLRPQNTIPPMVSNITTILPSI